MPHASVTAVIPAAGSGSRMGSPIPKQYLELLGTPILEWTLAAISRAEAVTAVILVVPADDVAEMEKKYLNGSAFPKVAAVVPGGAKRADSVYNGVRAAQTEWVLAHDAARPFVSPALTASTVAAALRHGAATAALPAHDTLKWRDGEFLAGSLDRATVLHIQTPQVFRRNDLLRAHEAMRGLGREWTDETSLLQQGGTPVAWVMGEPMNMKITTPDDFRLAQSLAERNPFVKGPARL